jgi:hypothetical protein
VDQLTIGLLRFAVVRTAPLRRVDADVADALDDTLAGVHVDGVAVHASATLTVAIARATRLASWAGANQTIDAAQPCGRRTDGSAQPLE